MTCTRTGGYDRYMANFEEHRLKAERAARLVQARKRAGFTGPTPVSRRSGILLNTYKAYEQGRNDFGHAAAKVLARLFDVPLKWLYLGEGSIDGGFEEESVPVAQAKADVIDKLDVISDADLLRLRDLVESFPAKRERR